MRSTASSESGWLGEAASVLFFLPATQRQRARWSARVDQRSMSVTESPRRLVDVTPGRTVRRLPKPTWWDSFLFLALMSGTPKFRDRDLMASLQGSIDA